MTAAAGTPRTDPGRMMRAGDRLRATIARVTDWRKLIDDGGVLPNRTCVAMTLSWAGCTPLPMEPICWAHSDSARRSIRRVDPARLLDLAAARLLADTNYVFAQQEEDRLGTPSA
jgi:hypothetical protein